MNKTKLHKQLNHAIDTLSQDSLEKFIDSLRRLFLKNNPKYRVGDEISDLEKHYNYLVKNHCITFKVVEQFWCPHAQDNIYGITPIITVGEEHLKELLKK